MLCDKIDCIQVLVGWIVGQIGVDVNYVICVGLFFKCDLMINMVFEFIDIQGVMGMYYVCYDGEVEDVVVVLNEQYQLCFVGDDLLFNLVVCVLVIVDKMDILVGIFGIGQYLKGDKDLFVLCCVVLGVLCIIVEKNFVFDL